MGRKQAKARQLKKLINKKLGKTQNNSLIIILSRSPEGKVFVKSCNVIQLHHDIVIKTSKDREDIEFWKTFDVAPIIAQVKAEQGIPGGPAGKTMQMPVQSIEAAGAINKLYTEPQKTPQNIACDN